MFDIDFYRKYYRFEPETYLDFERIRNKRHPFVYNIETTNACNMKCVMCPRTTKMTRPVETMKPELFQKIVSQLTPFRDRQWRRWVEFVQEHYGIYDNEMSENHFFLYIIPRVIQLHGYGDPLLDKNLSHYVTTLKQRGFESYFSCNPANINSSVIFMMKAGLDYIKFSIESVEDDEHKEIRGGASNFTQSYLNIKTLLNAKKLEGFKTTIIITMLDLDRPNQVEDYRKLMEKFEGEDVYIYLKSEDTQWYRGVDHGTNAIHWSEACKHPWMSMTIKSNGEAAMCMEDYNNEIVLGNANVESLKDIWNGFSYDELRKTHLNNYKGIRCTDYCEMGVQG